MTTRDDPFRDIEELLDQFTNFGTPISGDIPVDVVDTEEEVIVLANLPGRDVADIEVRLEDERSLQIETPALEDELDGRYVVRGRSRTAVSRSVRLPTAVDEDDTDASYDRGVLTVRLGKPSGGDGTEIPVN